MCHFLFLLLHSSITGQPVGDPVYYFNEWQEAEAHAQSHESSHLREDCMITYITAIWEFA